MGKVTEYQTGQQRTAGGAQRELCATGKRNNNFANQYAQRGSNGKCHQTELIQILVFFLSNLTFCSLGGSGGSQTFTLFLDVDLQDLGDQLYKQHHTHNTEGISNAVTDGCQIAAGSFNGGGKTGGAGQCAGHHTHSQIGLDTCQFHHTDTGSSAGQNDHKAENHVGNGRLLKITEETGTCNETHSGNKANEANVLQRAGDQQLKVTEYQRNNKDTGSAQRQPLDGNAAQQVTQRGNAEHDHKFIGENAFQKFKNGVHSVYISLRRL